LSLNGLITNKVASFFYPAVIAHT